ncbi:solute carrier family 35 member F2-like [Physella acuta]|uniref:solute carrier family 35 member F2-like n=1 Tax=Physella acuta TaxID=109671 RepID=UPI0027DE7538|nr:solute carrier family 35 member F2-like [Physella acuta]XP_059176993.1 solute carrier family 35 member F2-like [Physella acuta]XP_059176995.1 solute carrier family 35 member F2-like [Physella acuta]
MSSYVELDHSPQENQSKDKEEESLKLIDKPDVNDEVRHRARSVIKIIYSRQFLQALLLGQCLSILLCGTGVFSGLLQNRGINIPTAQSFLMYCALCLIFTTQLAYKQGERNLVNILKSFDGLKYALIGLIDVEANYLVVKAYGYTSVTSVQLLDCFSIGVVLLLSRFLLGTHYHLIHYAGVAVSVLGLAGLVTADVITGKNQDSGSNIVLGDVLVISGAVLYGVSNVAQEFVVKNYNKSEFLGMLGMFGTLVSGIQVILVEQKELAKVNFSSYEIALLWLGFCIFLFLIYTCMSIVIEKTSATVTNISVLTADFYALLFGIFIFGYTFHFLYLISFMVVIVGVAVYSFRTTQPCPNPSSG